LTKQKVGSKSEAAKKAWKKRKQKLTGHTVAQHRTELMLGVQDLLKEWNKSCDGQQKCVICGDSKPLWILQKHHLDPLNKHKGGTVWLCGSCHNIFNKAKMDTTLEETIGYLKLRHKQFKI
jgi:hypothetical protein